MGKGNRRKELGTEAYKEQQKEFFPFLKRTIP
jgi:hypothetical protein